MSKYEGDHAFERHNIGLRTRRQFALRETESGVRQLRLLLRAFASASLQGYLLSLEKIKQTRGGRRENLFFGSIWWLEF